MSDVKMVIVVRKDLKMRKGKMCAQVAHAAMQFLCENSESERGDELHVKLSPVEVTWMNGTFAKIVVGCDSEDELKYLMLKAEIEGVQCYSITDAGLTEFNGVSTLTCAAFGPENSEILNKITGDLKLL
jgi:PTH2 family peptidyl-tRNA hydrolase